PMVLLVERKVLGRFQGRYGPNRVGPFGMFQPMVDIVKLASKEDFIPRNASKMIFILAPVISLFTAVATIAILPFGNTVEDGLFGADYTLYGIDVSIGVLYAFAFGAIAFYGLMLGGWASGSKYSFLGAMRSAAQLISYELAAGLSLVGVIMMSGSLSMTEIVNQQTGMWFIIPQAVGFLVFMIAAFAETNRAPFDLVEADAELVAGYQTEYGGIRFAAFMLAEYMNMIVLSGIGVTMFLGGWLGPGPDWLGPIWVLVKIFLVLLFFMWIRATLPRLRYDQLMSFGWKILIPLATINLMVTAVLVVYL
ncbi:MAG: NADH-quinone oxidoreductase subunit NuoH, partial [Thermoleophilaceae bacterium]|nr:NADH-quinone oxidoreductase subunit NuoH [Thermoleophilaceae bacterium]